MYFSVTAGTPFVMVPVLSKQIALIFADASMASPPLTRIPFLAAFPTAAITTVGVASIRAQGQAITSTDMTLMRLCVANHTITQTMSTSGRNISENLSATFCALPF